MSAPSHPKPATPSEELERGLRLLVYDGVAAQVMTVLTSGAFLISFSLLLGASNFTIGVLSALQPLTQILQLPAIYLVERIGHRKRVVLVSLVLSRVFCFVLMLLPWVVPGARPPTSPSTPWSPAPRRCWRRCWAARPRRCSKTKRSRSRSGGHSALAGAPMEFVPLMLRGLDFVFLLTFVLGLYSLHRLLSVRETGEVDSAQVTAEFQAQLKKALDNISAVAGVRELFSFPYARLVDLLNRRKRKRA